MKEKREKLSLNELNVKSFVTSFKGKKVETVKGGGSNPVDTDPIACPADSDFNVCDEPTAIGATCEYTHCVAECDPVAGIGGTTAFSFGPIGTKKY